MKRKITYTNEPLGDIEVVPDFLPAPSELDIRAKAGNGNSKPKAKPKAPATRKVAKPGKVEV